jgi:hypothetical protein
MDVAQNIVGDWAAFNTDVFSFDDFNQVWAQRETKAVSDAFSF